MSDDEKKPDDKKKKVDKGAVPAAPPSNSKKTMIGIIAAIAVLGAAGWAVGNFITKTIAPAPPAEKPAEAAIEEESHGGGEEGHGEKGKGHGEKGGHVSEDGMLAKSKAMDTIDLKCNITSTGGTRYATMTVGVWVLEKYFEKLKEFKRPIQDRMEETLAHYQLDDINGPNFKARFRTEITKEVEKLLKSIEPKLLQGTEQFVTWIDITAPLTQ